MRIKIILIGIAAMFIMLAQLLAQPNPQGPQGGSRGPGGGRGGRGFGDPEQLWIMISGGKDVINRSDISDPRMQGMFDSFAQRMGITNGQLTKQQFMAISQQRGTGPGGGSPGGFAGPGQGGGPGGMPPNLPPGQQGGAGGPPTLDQRAEASFRRHDLNGDGVLNFDEMPPDLRAERDRWDTNGDGFIDLNEYKEYYKARWQQTQLERGWGDPLDGSGWTPDADIIPPDEDKKPVVYRAGKLPKELPAWFQQLDTDGDGQIGLYEWKNSGRTLEEFQKIDRNGDGFLTPDEVLYYVVQSKKGGKNQTAVVDATISNSNGPPNFNPGSRFGRPADVGASQTPQGTPPQDSGTGSGRRGRGSRGGGR